MGRVFIFQRDAVETTEFSRAYSAVDVYSDRTEAEDTLRSRQYQLILIHLERESDEGMELAALIRGIPGYSLTPIIFLAKDRGCEQRAFHEIHCYDYLLKPLRKEEIIKILYPFVQQECCDDRIRKMTFRLQGKTYVVDAKDVLYMQCANRCVHVYTVYGTLVVPYLKFQEFIEGYPDVMVQCHRSAAVNRNFVKTVDYRHKRIELRGGQVDIGRGYIQRLREEFAGS